MALGLALVSLIGLAAYFLFQRIKLPGMLGMLLAGVLMGLYVLDFIHPDLLRASADFRKIALIIILLRAGFEMSRGSRWQCTVFRTARDHGHRRGFVGTVRRPGASPVIQV